VPDAAALMPDRRARHFWDGQRVAGRAFPALELGEERLRGSDAWWDTYLLFDREARWPAGGDAPRPAWWEHQLQHMPDERRLDAARFAAKAASLEGTP